MLRLILNLIWVVVAGVELALAYVLAGILSVLLIVTLPLAVPAFRMAWYAIWPFGRTVVEQPGAGAGSTLANIVWFVLIGWWVGLAHLIIGLVLCLTIIGIPFGVAAIKMAKLAASPYGRDVVPTERARRGNVRVIDDTTPGSALRGS